MRMAGAPRVRVVPPRKHTKFYALAWRSAARGGREVFKSTGTTDPQVAADLARRLEYELYLEWRGLPVPEDVPGVPAIREERVTFRRLVDTFMVERHARSAANTRRWYEKYTNPLVAFFGPDRDPMTVNDPAWAEFAHHWRRMHPEKGRGPETTLFNYERVLWGIFTWASKRKPPLVASVPFNKLEGTAKPRRRTHKGDESVIPVEECRAIMRALNLERPVHRAIWFALNFGMCLEDFKALDLNRHLTTENILCGFERHKSGVPFFYPVPPPLLDTLHWLREHYPLPGAGYPNHTNAIRGTTPRLLGEPVTYKGPDGRRTRCRTTKRYGNYVMRHTWNTELQAADVAEGFLAVLMAHSSGSVTGRYGHLRTKPEALRERAARLPWLDEMQTVCRQEAPKALIPFRK